jgi:anti-anti-sigma factor
VASRGVCSLVGRQRRGLKYRVPVRAPTLRALSAAEPTVIAPEGELDFARVGDFRAALSDAAREGAAVVVVDLSQVSFIDSSGLGAIVELHNRLRRGGRRLAVVAPSGSAPAVLFDLAGLRGRLPISDTRGAALDA